MSVISWEVQSDGSVRFETEPWGTVEVPAGLDLASLASMDSPSVGSDGWWCERWATRVLFGNDAARIAFSVDLWQFDDIRAELAALPKAHAPAWTAAAFTFDRNGNVVLTNELGGQHLVRRCVAFDVFVGRGRVRVGGWVVPAWLGQELASALESSRSVLPADVMVGGA